MELPSRHSRGLKDNSASNAELSSKNFRNTYKIFIQYEGNINKPNAIKCKNVIRIFIKTKLIDK